MLLQIELYILAAMLVIMAAAWAVCLVVKDGGWTDVFWTFGTGAVLATAALLASGPEGMGPRHMLVAALLAIWSLRLGLYLAPRVASHAEDPRYAQFRTAKNHALMMLFVTLPQAPASALLGLSPASTSRTRR